MNKDIIPVVITFALIITTTTLGSVSYAKDAKAKDLVAQREHVALIEKQIQAQTAPVVQTGKTAEQVKLEKQLAAQRLVDLSVEQAAVAEKAKLAEQAATANTAAEKAAAQAAIEAEQAQQLAAQKAAAQQQAILDAKIAAAQKAAIAAAQAKADAAKIAASQTQTTTMTPMKASRQSRAS